MEISIVPVNEKLAVTIQYRKDIYSEDTVERIWNHYKTILEAAIDNPDQSIHELSMMSHAEIRQIVEDWNSEKAVYPTDVAIHQLIDAAAKENPDAIALTYEGRNISYHDLVNRSNYIACRLIEMGAGPEVMIGVYMVRSHDLVITLLAILKAGGVYIPLDPIYPDEKLIFMLRDSSAPILITDELIAKNMDSVTIDLKFPDYGGKVVTIESLLSKYSEEKTYDIPHVNISSENGAYLIYTSGSTGNPKGVFVTHRNVVNFFCFMNSYIDDAAASRIWLFSTSISFDPSVLEMFWTLSRGYQVVVLPNESSGKFLDISAIPELIQKHQVSHFQATPSVLSMLVDKTDGIKALKQLSKLMVGGESLPFTLAKKLSSELSIDIYNVYGPTEATIWATCHTLSKDDACVPIGRPLPNYNIYILDKYFHPVPIGVYGELFIGGDGVAHEYFNDPELTERKYLPDPFSLRQGDRMYQTGDLARYGANGVIEFRGRADRQVKVRGHRIELGEIEAAIIDCGEVRETAVIASGETDIDRQLLGYVIPDFNSVSADELDSYKEERLNGWRSLWDQTYYGAVSNDDIGFNTVGWNSIYNNKPIPPEEMREWVETTVGRIRSLQPKHVLEIGCGTGLLLFRIAPDCASYYATDVSAYAIESLNREINERSLNQVSLSQRMAHDFSDLDARSFDTIILNSVIQYFPSASYLSQVLENAMRLLLPGGHIFLGDIRNFDLLGCMYASVGISRATNQLTLNELRGKVKFMAENERELAISPAWFSSLFRQSDNIGEIVVQLKRGRITNEINQFRYDVILYPDQKRDVVPEIKLQWLKDVSSVQDIIDLITHHPDYLLKLFNIPNPRLSRERAQWLKLNDPKTGNLRELYTTYSLENNIAALDDFWKVEDIYKRPVVIDYGKDDPFTVEICIFPQNLNWISTPGHAVELKSGHHDYLTTDPLWPIRAHNLKKCLKEKLRSKLPEFMIPSSLTILKEFPKLTSGKIDRKSLPLPELPVSGIGGFKNILSPIETSLMEIWEDVLGFNGFSINDNFIDIGGNSLSAIMIINRIKSILNVKIITREFFENPTVKLLTKLVDKQIENPLYDPLDEITQIDRHEEMPLPVRLEGRLKYQLSLDAVSVPYLHASSFFSIKLSGSLNCEALKSAFDYVINRHEVFRTAIWPIMGTTSPPTNRWNTVCRLCRMNPEQLLPKIKFKQSVQPTVTMNLSCFDVSKYDEKDKNNEINIIADEILQRRYDYESLPLTRAALIRADESEYILIVAASNLIADAFSMNIYEKELAYAYNALVDGQSVNFADVKFQYADYVAWMERRLESGSMDSAKSYWERQFNGYTPAYISMLPFADIEGSENDRDFDIEAKYYHHPVSDELRVSIRKYASSVNMTAFGIAMTGFILCLYYESGKNDIGVLTFFANRTRSETENIIGPLSTNNIIRVMVNADDSLHQCAESVSESLAGALKNQELIGTPPVSRICKSLYDLVACRPITCELLTDDECASFSGLDAAKVIMARGKSEYALRSFVIDSREKLSLLFQYNLDLFDGNDIRRIAARTESIIKEIITNPSKAVSSQVNYEK